MDSDDRRSAILSAIANGSTFSQAGRDVGVSGARARRVAREAALPLRRPGGIPSSANGALGTRTARGSTLLLRLAVDAADRGLTPEEYLRRAALALARSEP